ncbi:hypothetical protein [Runella sp.]|uniref:hypothetical protein n=1 Tax=Runella sp. TaxID=1960881 RepID=UPI0030165F47
MDKQMGAALSTIQRAIFIQLNAIGFFNRRMALIQGVYDCIFYLSGCKLHTDF